MYLFCLQLIGLVFLAGGCMVKLAADKVDAILRPLLTVSKPEISQYVDIAVEVSLIVI